MDVREREGEREGGRKRERFKDCWFNSCS